MDDQQTIIYRPDSATWFCMAHDQRTVFMFKNNWEKNLRKIIFCDALKLHESLFQYV